MLKIQHSGDRAIVDFEERNNGSFLRSFPRMLRACWRTENKQCQSGATSASTGEHLKIKHLANKTYISAIPLNARTLRT